MAAVLEIVKRITGFIVGVLIGCMMERWAYKKIWNLKKPSRVKEISIRFLQWVIVLLLIFLFLVAVDLLEYAAIKAVVGWSYQNLRRRSCGGRKRLKETRRCRR